MFAISSPAFKEGGEIPTEYTCEGNDLSPELVWAGMPEGTASFVLICDDPDAPDPAAPKMTYVHWVLYNLPGSSNGLEKNVKRLPSGTLEGTNDWNRTDYGGPCPPIGRHRYFFKLHALDVLLPDLDHPTKGKLLSVMEGHVIDHVVLMGTYQKLSV